MGKKELNSSFGEPNVALFEHLLQAYVELYNSLRYYINGFTPAYSL